MDLPDGIDYRLLFDSVPDPCLVLDPELRIVEVNRAYLATTLTLRDELIGRELFEVFPDNPEETDATGSRNARASLLRVLKSRGPDAMAVLKYDIRRPEAQGGGFEERYWSVINSPVLSPDGGLSCIIHRVQDVTEFMRLKELKRAGRALSEEMHERAVQMDAESYNRALEIAAVNMKLAKANDELERKNGELQELNGRLAAEVAARVQAQEALHEANLELARSNRDLEAFTYTAAHDLRQPLNIISGYCQAVEMICGEELDQQCQGYLKDIHRGTLRMSRLIDSLLTFSRMSRVQLQKKRVDLSALAHDVAEELKQGDPQRRDVTFRIGSGITVNGDPELIRIVLNNLMGNAWKFTAGAPEPLIEVGATTVAGETACLVRDNGTGFDMNEAHRLFAAFQRLQGAETRHGFGIGLATVERIILRHGGRVWAQGEPGKGATFYFTLPAEET